QGIQRAAQRISTAVGFHQLIHRLRVQSERIESHQFRYRVGSRIVQTSSLEGNAIRFKWFLVRPGGNESRKIFERHPAGERLALPAQEGKLKQPYEARRSLGTRTWPRTIQV